MIWGLAYVDTSDEKRQDVPPHGGAFPWEILQEGQQLPAYGSV